MATNNIFCETRRIFFYFVELPDAPLINYVKQCHFDFSRVSVYRKITSCCILLADLEAFRIRIDDKR